MSMPDTSCAGSGHAATFTKRECFNAHRARFPRATDLDAVLAVLEDHGYIRLVPRDPGPGRPTQRYEVNPAAHNAQKPQNP